MKNVFISGIDGDMGQRYATILVNMGINVVGADKESPLWSQSKYIAKPSNNVDGVIIASPTQNHIDSIKLIRDDNPKIPILCEKPLDLNNCRFHMENVTMVNQYKFLIPKEALGGDGPTEFNYYKHGKDGLEWDCINIIGLANGSIQLGDNAAKWHCVINGHKINLKHMDDAYALMIIDWMDNPEGNLEYINEAHHKVHLFINQEDVTQSKTEKKPRLKVVKE